MEEIWQKKRWKVYAHILKKDNRAYIGITGKENPVWRWGTHGEGYTTPINEKLHHRKFANAINKYGWDNFDHIILEENLLPEEAEKLEVEYIIKFNSIKNGFNQDSEGNAFKNIQKKQNSSFLS